MSTSPNIPVGWYRESQFTRPSKECREPEWWHTRDIQGTEVEVIEMVAGMIRGHQPDVVLETGTSRGFMSQAIGQALRQNGHGTLHTYEPDTDTLNEACRLWWTDDENEMVLPIVPYAQESMQEWTNGPIDFAWHDSLIQLRQPEFEFYLEHYSERAIVCFHDTAAHFGPWSDRLRTALLSQGFSYLDWPSPRGAIIARKNP